mmetsp:Transcript_18919/g.40815  ORF Transcript_18919/g.40815 Transcript_18919/m.40815 type:complete len:239 (-) Transcript_18919:1093-1809(-)
MPLIFNYRAVPSPFGDTPELLRADLSDMGESHPTGGALSPTARVTSLAPRSTQRSKRSREVTLANDFIVSAPAKRRLRELVSFPQPSNGRSETPRSSLSSVAEAAGDELFSILIEPGFSALTPQAGSTCSLSTNDELAAAPASLTNEAVSQTSLLLPPISVSPAARIVSPATSHATPPSCSLSPPCRRPTIISVCPDAPRRDLSNLPRADFDNEVFQRRSSRPTMRFRSVLAQLINAH